MKLNVLSAIFAIASAVVGLACSGSGGDHVAANNATNDASNSQTNGDAGSSLDSTFTQEGSVGAGVISVAGAWALHAQWGSGESVAPMQLAQSGGALTGGISWWYVEATGTTRTLGTTLTGAVTGSSVTLDRVDTSGFQSLFVGAVSADGNTMAGTVANDPNSPGGNSATGTWTATRSADGGVSVPEPGADSGSNPDGSSADACVTLAQCCVELTGNSASDCASAAGQGSIASCTTALNGYWATGLCGDLSTGPVDAGALSDAPAEATSDAAVCGPPVINSLLGFAPTACMANGICSAVLGSGCAVNQTTLASCPCQGVQLCCLFGNGETCYYSLAPSAIADQATNCQNLPGMVSLSP